MRQTLHKDKNERTCKMKATFLALGIGAGLAAGAAELNWKAEKPWEKKENGDFTINYQTPKRPRLISRQTVTAGKFYRAVFNCKRDGDSIPSLVLMANDGGKNFGPSVYTFNGWTTQCAYFPAAKDGNLSVLFFFNPRAAGKLTVKNGKFEEVTPEMMKQNLVINGNFEDETFKGTGFWKSSNWKDTVLPGKVVEGMALTRGKRSLELPFGKGIQSIFVPMEKGKKYQLSFWARGTKNAVGTAAFSLWSARGHKGKHFWKSLNFKLENDWKEYNFEVEIPTDESVWPDLAVGTGTISFIVKGSDGKYYLDDISYCEK